MKLESENGKKNIILFHVFIQKVLQKFCTVSYLHSFLRAENLCFRQIVLYIDPPLTDGNTQDIMWKFLYVDMSQSQLTVITCCSSCISSCFNYTHDYVYIVENYIIYLFKK